MVSEKYQRFDPETKLPYKRLICDIPLAVHTEIAVIARRRGISMAAYMRQILLEELKKEVSYYDE